ncbi:MAG: dihydrolipoyl dehydrogenase [Deltaproteobacteria bacterium]|nr:dihydrolipoyl dehydrogenase [Deltaproteobacteria bacterium]
MENFDVIVIGSGGGTKIALPAAKRGLKTALIEQSSFGGTCLNRGCIPSKMLIYPADVILLLNQAHRLNLSIPQPIDADFTAMVERVNSTVDLMSQRMADQVSQLTNIELIKGQAKFVSDKVVQVNGRLLHAEKFFIATGAVPAIPDIGGLAETPYMTSNEALRCLELPKRMIIVGASYIACELGHVYGAFGTETHFLVRSELLRTEDEDVRNEFAQCFEKQHQIHQGVVPLSVRWEDGLFTVMIRHLHSGKEEILEAEALLISVGVEPVTAELGLENTAIHCDAKGFISVNDRLETAVEGVYALGDCVGNYLFRHSVNFEGEYLMRTLFDHPSQTPIRYGAMPRAVFTVPEVAAVGVSEAELLQQQVDFVVGKANYVDSNMGLARQLDHGFVKLLFDRNTQHLLGAHIIGEEASDMVHMLIVLLQKQGTLQDLLDMIFIHPALPELVRDAARDANAKL